MREVLMRALTTGVPASTNVGTGSSDLQFPFRFMSLSVTDEVLSRLVATAFAGQDATPDLLVRQLRNTLRRHVRVQGFAHIERAPRPVLVRATTKAFARSSELAGAVLAVWSEVRRELRVAVDEFLLGRAIEPVELTQGFRDVWSLTEATACAEALVEHHPTVDREEALVMICWRAGRLPLDQADLPELDGEAVEGETTENRGQPAAAEVTRMHGGQDELAGVNVPIPLAGSKWAQVLREASGTPCEAREWDLVPEFVEALSTLAKRKVTTSRCDRPRPARRFAIRGPARPARAGPGWAFRREDGFDRSPWRPCWR